MLDIFWTDGFCERDGCVKIRDFYGNLTELCSLRRTHENSKKGMIFELAWAGIPKIRKSKIYYRCLRTFARFLQKIAHFCENLQIFAKICKFLRKFTDFCENLHIFANICRFLRKFADFCENLQIFAKICRSCENLPIFAKICTFLRKFADCCEHLHIFAKIARFLRKVANFCENLQICENP